MVCLQLALKGAKKAVDAVSAPASASLAQLKALYMGSDGNSDLQACIGSLIVMHCGLPDAFKDKCFQSSSSSQDLLTVRVC